MPPRISPNTAAKKNIFGLKLKKIRLGKKIAATDLCIRLQRKGWDVSPAVYCHIESGRRLLTDVELVLILRVLNVRLSDLE